MSLPDELHFWKQEAKRLEARVQRLETENQALKQLTGTCQVVPPDEHGRENVALDRAADQGQTNPAPEPVERDICADGDRVRENFHENPAPLSSQLRRRSSFNEIVFVVEVPQSQPARVSNVDKFLRWTKEIQRLAEEKGGSWAFRARTSHQDLLPVDYPHGILDYAF